MAIKSRHELPARITIDLNGPEGNAFVLMGKAKGFARDLGLDGELIVQEMMLGDYEDLIKTFDHYFGEFVDLYR
jgi:hypothetical protein